MKVTRTIDKRSGIIFYKKSNGEYHREDGPALIYPDGTAYWYQNDKLYRKDGPVIMGPDGTYSCYDGDFLDTSFW